MTPLKATNFRIDEEMLGGLQEIRKRIGIPVSEQVRRAIQRWLDENKPPSARRERELKGMIESNDALRKPRGRRGED